MFPLDQRNYGDPVFPLDQRNWGPGGPRPRSALVEPWTPSSTVGWRAYHKAMFPPGGLVTPWIRFKVMSTGVNVARRLWDQREELREAYEVEHGSEQDGWPHRHPGIVLTAVQFVAHAACLGCQWLAQPGTSMSDEGWREAPPQQRADTKIRTGSFAVNRTSSSCRWGHPALMRATLGA